MSGMKLDIVTAERAVYSEDVEAVIAPGVEGQLGILPHHAPLMTTLQPGELIVKKGGEEVRLVITGGFLEVRPDRVVVLADAAERAEEIDVSRAEEARRRAEQPQNHIRAYRRTGGSRCPDRQRCHRPGTRCTHRNQADLDAC